MGAIQTTKLLNNSENWTLRHMQTAVKCNEAFPYVMSELLE